MVNGLNSDLRIKNKLYHIQTQDWGFENQYIESQIYRDGQILNRFKIEYNEITLLGDRPENPDIRIAMERLHSQILDLLVSGQIFED